MSLNWFNDNKIFLYVMVLLCAFMANRLTVCKITIFQIPKYHEIKYHEAVVTDILMLTNIQLSFNYLALPFGQYSGESLSITNFVHDTRELKVENGATTIFYFPCDSQKTYVESMILMLKKVGINHIFTPSAPLQREILGVNIVSIPFPLVQVIEPNAVKDVKVSFIGQISHVTRSYIKQLRGLDSFFVQINSGFFPTLPINELQTATAVYKDILGRSRYSLCPRGYEPGSIRFWESLHAGAIPILLADNYRLPEIFDWNTCVIRVAEKDFAENPKIIVDIINSISPKKELAMRQACYEASKASSGDNLVSAIIKYFDK